MQQMDSVFFMSAKDLPEALRAIHNLAGKETIKGPSNQHYSWVRSDFDRTSTFDEAMRAWRWSVEFDVNGNIENIQFEGEKLGDDLVLFQAIAPFVKKDSYIQMQGEDGSLWRWKFDGTTCQEVSARIEWDDDEEEEDSQEDESTIDEAFQNLASQINRKLKEAASALREANRLKEEAGLETLFFSAYLRDEHDEEECEELEEKLQLIDVGELEGEMESAGWSTSSSYC